MDSSSNLAKFAQLVASVVEREGTTIKDGTRFRTKPHGARRADNRRVNKAAKMARKLNRTNGKRRSTGAAPRNRKQHGGVIRHRKEI